MKETHPLVSIGMPVYNGDRYLRLALDSLLAQDYQYFELIISDNASTDSTAEICQEYAAKDSRIRYLRNLQNIGSPQNFNKVFELSKGQYFMWAAHDDLWERTYIKKCVSKLENNPEAVLCCTDFEFIDEKGQLKQDSWMKKCKNREIVGMDIFRRVDQLIAWINWYEIYGLIRSASLKNTRLFREEYGPDVILLLELLLLGDIAKVHEPLFFYRIFENQESSKEKARYQFPYSSLAKNLLKLILESPEIELALKAQIRRQFIHTLSFKNLDWLAIIAGEQSFSLAPPRTPEEIQQWIKNLIAPTLKEITPSTFPQKLKILYDISVLGLGHYYPLAKTGVFRVVEKIATGLLASSEIDLKFCAVESPRTFQWCQNYLLGHPLLQNVTLSQSVYSEVDLFHSPYYFLPVEKNQRPKIITIYDLIPILYPEFFQNCENHSLKQILSQLSPQDWAICISNHTKNDLCKYALIPPERVFVTHLAADQDIFYPCLDGTKVSETLKKYSIPQENYILSLSTLEPRKNIEGVIQAFAKLLREQNIEQLNLVLVGSKGWDFNTIFTEIENHKWIQKRIFVTGYVADEDLAALYSGALVFVYPSFYEGFGLPPLEAMQCGVPVITSNTSSLPEVVGDAGIMMDPTDIEGLSQAILTLYNQPDLRQAMSFKSLEQAKKFSWDKCINETIAAYKTALSAMSLTENQTQLTVSPKIFKPKPLTIIIDGIFYQINNTGIARVWISLLQEWVKTGFAKQILFLDRAGTAPRIPGVKYLCIPSYDYNNTEADRRLLQDICDEENADIFISTYYTTPLTTPSVFMAYDMIPERYPTNLNAAMWREKHQGIRHGSAYITISEQTARDLVEFFPEIPRDRVTVAPCGIKSEFRPTTPAEITTFKSKYRLSKPYFLWVGSRTNINSYKNAILFFQAFAQLPNRQEFDILCVGGEAQLEVEFQPYISDTLVHLFQLSDSELRLAYSGAIALIYTSKYEGFGLPVLEAMACGCPVITCPNGAIPEVAGQAVIYVKDNDIFGLVNAMQEIQKPEVRNSWIAAGLQRQQKFSWEKMAEIVRSTLLATAQNPRKEAIASPSYRTPSEPNTLTHFQQSRQQLAQQWLQTPEEQLQSAYLGELGTAHKALLESGIKYQAITPSEQAFIRQLSTSIAQGFDAPNALQSFIAATLYCYPHQLQIPYKNAPIPKWFAQDYLKFMFASPTLFHELGEVEQYYCYFQGWIEYVHHKILTNPDSPLWQSVAEFFTQGNANFAPLYFTRGNPKSLYRQRADIIEYALKNRGFHVDYIFPPRSANRPKIRLGILKNHFNSATETLVILPVFEHFDRNQFEIFLYAEQVKGSQLEGYCQSRADRLVKLPESLSEQVQTFRNDDLDILFIGTNITELNKPLTALAQHRLARVQVTSIASPVTTGIRNIDYYIAGNLTAPMTTSSEQYCEKLINIEGSGLCFRFPFPEPASTVNPTRASWGATDQTVVFMSGANFYKIIPELSETWAKIMAAVPNSILVLYPFGPAWNSTYPAKPFVERIHRIFAQQGIDKQRLVLINTLPSPADIKECVKLADVYLDSYPYSGATSLLDPLQLGIPAIAWEDSSLRSRQASALLREIQLTDLIAQDEPGYIQLAIKLGTNPQLRHQYRQQIQQKMQQNPPFLDSVAYGKKMGNLFQQLFQVAQNSAAMANDKSTQIPSQPVSVSQEFLNRLIGCANLYYIDPSDESIQRELIQLRREFAELWLQIPSDRLRECYTQKLGKAHQSVLNSGIQNQPLPEIEQRFVQELIGKLTPGLNAPLGMNALLAVLLYQQRDRLPQFTQLLPDWVNA
ncbi:glycosyltransferase [Laspinema sp. A4]|uniref:glycosyltransferase n=1 Tax=Laspinema sp. D2d TaxID=2953686 RepID=UPI0021BAF2B8|nr:glycosyltransferase [Laspinema sp. D2d]MCT7982337.1 glycosyltransferase [Laspinema sp. D2d]